MAAQVFTHDINDGRRSDLGGFQPRGRLMDAVRARCAVLSPSITRGEVLWEFQVSSRQKAVTELIQSIITKNMTEDNGDDPFYVFDLGALTHLYARWTSSFPGIKAYYAFKCNPNPLMLSAMNALGANYDCASKAEIAAVLELGVDPSRIIFANPCKAVSHIRFAGRVGVNLTTFDSVDEVEKIKKWHPGCSLLLRIKPPEEDGACVTLGSKYGAPPEEILPLLNAAKEAGLPVIGVAFHVGTEMAYSNPYRLAIKAAREAFDLAEKLGMPPMHVLDIGGGFSADGDTFEHHAAVIRGSIAEYFRDKQLSSVFGEPGRFFAEKPFTLAAAIIGKRMRPSGKGASDRGDNAPVEIKREYWLNDGIYGSMSRMIVRRKTIEPTAIVCPTNLVGDPSGEHDKKQIHPSTVFGPTCDSIDKFLTDYPLPDLQIGDWLIFSDMGAYTTSAGTSFNGFATSDIKTYLATPSFDVSAGPLPLDDSSLPTLPNSFFGTT